MGDLDRACKYHNRKYPNDRIHIFGLIPAEFREVDEGQQWITYKACRNVYINYSICLPLAAGFSILLPAYSSNASIVLGALGLGQYIGYGLTIRKFNRA